jgi:hypothetical protein
VGIMVAAIAVLVATYMAAYEARIRKLEESKHIGSEPEVTNERALHDLVSPACVIGRSSINSTQGNNILFLLII